MTRLTPELAAQIRTWHASGVTVAECARRAGIGWTHAKRIVSGESWTGRSRRHAVDAATVRRVRALVASGEKHDSVAFDLGLSRSYVTHIANRTRRANG